MELFVYFVTVPIFLTFVSTELNPLSDEFIDLINKKQTTWKAGRNFHAHTPISKIEKLMGVLPDNYKVRLQEQYHSESDEIPESFDSRQAWPNCAKVIGEIRDQANCGSCWAFGAVAAMSDRICIYTNATIQVSISAEDLVSCCSKCGFGCHGGYLARAWQFWATRGLVSGGAYGSNIGCKPYSIEPCNHYSEDSDSECHGTADTPACTNDCIQSYNKTFIDDLYFGNAYFIPQSARQMQLEILRHGPIEVAFVVYEDFVTYKSGVYKHVEGKEVGRHAAKILGWGVENGTRYWLAANSWNDNWGDSGYFKILRGKDHCEIESSAVAGLPMYI